LLANLCKITVLAAAILENVFWVIAVLVPLIYIWILQEVMLEPNRAVFVTIVVDPVADF
jgi:hypothetical protein